MPPSSRIKAMADADRRQVLCYGLYDDKIQLVDDYDENETIVDDVILRKNRTRAPSKEEQQSNRGMLPKLL